MYKHYLNFLDLPLIGKIEISEPFKFDGATHEIKREKGRHSRDVIIANQDIELEFYKEHFVKNLRRLDIEVIAKNHQEENESLSDENQKTIYRILTQSIQNNGQKL